MMFDSISRRRINQAVWILSAFFLVLLRAFSEAKSNPCRKHCVNARMRPSFLSPQGQLAVYVTKCVIISGDLCEVDFSDSIQPLKDQATTEFYLAVMCKSATVLRLVNSRNVQRRRVVSFFQLLGPCRVSVADVSRFGDATDYRVQLFVRAATLVANNTTNTTGIPGMHNLGTVALESSGVRGVPDIFTRFKWPKMAEVAFSNLSITAVPDALKVTMPRLQSLELNNNTLSRPPDFPWDDSPLELPRNLSRKAVFNHHYQQGTIVLPNLYRRFLVLDHNNIRDLSTHQFNGFLQKLSLRDNGLIIIGPNCFSNLTGINIIDLSLNKLSMIPAGLFNGMDWMLELRLENNNLSDLPPRMFKDMRRLQRLYLHNNQLQRIESGLLSTNEQLEQLTLHNNHITVIEDNALPENSNTLKTLNLNNNRLSRVPSAVFLLRNLATADLSFNRIDFSGILKVLNALMMERLLLNLRDSASSLVSRLKTHTVSLNLANNNIQTINLKTLNQSQLAKLKAIFHVFKINLRYNPLNCDCKLLALSKMLKELINKNEHITHARFDSWVCAAPRGLKGRALLRVREDQFLCVVDLKNCPRHCACAIRETDGRVIVDCRTRGLQALPDKMPSGKLEVYLEGNSITELGLRDYLANVTVLRLSRNNIKILNMTFLNNLTDVSVLMIDNNKLRDLPRGIPSLTSRAGFRTLSIHHNFFTCDCHARWMQLWINNNTDKIMDISSVLCASPGGLRGKPISSAPIQEFICPTPLPPYANQQDPVPLVVAIVFAVLLVIAIMLFTLLYFFRGEMKILMYTHFNWHPFDRVDDSDSGKIYDAFVSHSSHDYRWVNDTLRRRLEEHDPPYKLCLHDRDFEIGALIHENILNSVHHSKRMLMVLSNNYVNSEWCMLEFRAAHQKVLEDKTNYLIIILFDDVDTNALDEETKLYLRTNTYLSVSNRWFWEKLLYALPQRRAVPGPKEDEITDIVSDIVYKSRESKEALVFSDINAATPRDKMDCTTTQQTKAESKV